MTALLIILGVAVLAAETLWITHLNDKIRDLELKLRLADMTIRHQGR